MIHIVSGLAEGQVLQRVKSGGADCVLRLSLSEPGPVLVAVAQGKRSLRGWSKRRAGVFRKRTGTITLKNIPTGGPYRLRIESGKSLQEVKYFYVGDVWLLAGQSNMEGIGNIAGASKPHPLIRAFSMRREWRQAADPLHLCMESPDECHSFGRQFTREQSASARKQATKGVGPGLFFAQCMLKKSGAPQGLICTAHGGTSMAQWDPELRSRGGESLYASMLASVQATGQPVAGVLWYQGESDARPDAAEEYTARMERLVAAVRRDLKQPTLPWIMAQIGRVFGLGEHPSTFWNAIQDQQRLLPSRIRNLDVVSTIDLPLDDFVHISSAGIPRLAQRMAQLAERLVYRRKNRPGAPKVKRVRGAISGGAQRIFVEYDHIDGGLVAAGEPHGFALVDDAGKQLPLIYKVTFKENRAELHLSQPLPEGVRLHYGLGFTPVCNILDRRGQALPVFGPLRVSYDEAWLPFVSRWKVTPILTDKRALADLGPLNVDELGAVVKSYGTGGFINEHAQWEGKSGYAVFAASLELPEPMRLEVLMGYDGPFRLWINDAPFFSNLAGINPCFADESAKSVKLVEGVHRLQVAMDLNAGLAWGFFLRFKRKDVTRSQLRSECYKKPVYLV